MRLNSGHLIFIRIPYASDNGGIFFLHTCSLGVRPLSQENFGCSLMQFHDNVLPGEFLKLLLDENIKM